MGAYPFPISIKSGRERGMLALATKISNMRVIAHERVFVVVLYGR